MAGSIEKLEGDDFSDRPVPVDQRMAAFPLTMAWWSVCSAMFYLVVAATLALAYGARNAIIGMVLTVIVYGIIAAILTRHAVRTGLSVSLFSRILLGRSGAAIATLIYFATATYYAVFEGSVISVALSKYAGISQTVSALIVAVSSVLLILGSIRNWLDKFNGVLLPFYLLGLGAAVVLTIMSHGYSDAWLNLGPEGGAPAGGWWNCFVAYMGVWVVLMYNYDYARFGKVEDRSYHSLFNFGSPFYVVTFLINGLIGIFLAANLPTEGAVSEVSVVFALIALMGLAGLLFVWISQARINTANYYLAAVNLESFAELTIGLRLPRLVWACLIGVISYVLMLADVFSYILQALAWQGIFVVAWVAIAVVHILANDKIESDPEKAGRLLAGATPIDVVGISSWCLGSVAGIALHVAGGSLGTFSAPVTAVIAAASYGGLRALTQKRVVASGVS